MIEYDGKYVSLMLCSDCNNNCRHCYINYKGRFTDEQLSIIVPKLLKKYTVLMNGTEPIIYEEYIKYFKLAKNNILMTNGIALMNNQSLINKIKENGINEIALSYHYGIQDEISLIKIEELDFLIKELKNNGFTIKLMCSLSNDNYKKIAEFCKKAYSLGVDKIRFTNFINQGQAISNFDTSKYLDRKKINYVLDEIKNQRKRYDKNELYIERCGSFGPNYNISKNNFNCLAINNMVAITPDRNVYSCIFDTSLGNEIGYLDDNNRIMIDEHLIRNTNYCKILKKYNNIDN